MFFFYRDKITGLVEKSYLKTKRLVFNSERARDIAGILLRIPKFTARGMTISNSEHAAIILKLHENFDSNELRILNEKSTYDGKNKGNSSIKPPQLGMPYPVQFIPQDIPQIQQPWDFQLPF